MYICICICKKHVYTYIIINLTSNHKCEPYFTYKNLYTK